MYPLERWTRTSLVRLCLWLSLLFSMQQPGAADPNEWAHGVDSVIAASGGFSSLTMRGCASTKAPDAEGSRRRRRRHGRSRTDEAYEELRAVGFPSPTLYGALESSSQGHCCALTFELSRAWRQGA